MNWDLDPRALEPLSPIPRPARLLNWPQPWPREPSRRTGWDPLTPRPAWLPDWSWPWPREPSRRFGWDLDPGAFLRGYEPVVNWDLDPRALEPLSPIPRPARLLNWPQPWPREPSRRTGWDPLTPRPADRGKTRATVTTHASSRPYKVIYHIRGLYPRIQLPSELSIS